MSDTVEKLSPRVLEKLAPEMQIIFGQESPWASPFTFVRAPHTRDVADADIVFVGLPWDHTQVARGGGSRHAPAAVREWSVRTHLIPAGVGSNWPYHFNLFEVCKFVDYGDLEYGAYHCFINEMLQVSHDAVRDILDAGATPLVMGGDHLMPIGPVRAVAEKYGPLGMIHVDAHPDDFDEGDDPMYWTTGSLCWTLPKEGAVDPDRSITVGLRTYRDIENKPIKNVLWGHDVRRLGPKGTAQKIREAVGDGPTIISFDIDGVDPMDMPATSWPAPGGPDVHTWRGILYYLQGINLVYADMCELHPWLDPTQRTSFAAAALMVDMAHLMAIARGKAEAHIEYEW